MPTEELSYLPNATGLRAGADDYLCKPYSTDELRLRIRRRIDASRPSDKILETIRRLTAERDEALGKVAALQTISDNVRDSIILCRPDGSIEAATRSTGAILGLPSGTLWANINVGGNASEWYGDYFAYGETQPKESYTQANCTTYGKELGYDIAGTEYDAATVNWGDLWSSPTYDQCNELMNSNNTSLEAVTINGYNCWKVTSKIEGYTDKYILMPRGGRRSGMGYYETPGGDAVFAPSTRYNTSYCYDFFLRADNNRWIGYNYRWYGYTMRPVVNSRNLVKAAGGTLINVRTEGCDLTVGGTTATLHGRASSRAASVASLTVSSSATLRTLMPLPTSAHSIRSAIWTTTAGSRCHAILTAQRSTSVPT